ncbi:glycosyltransferase family 2 protein [Flavobacterium cellulosilyticum]|uniref:Glycosyltransferase family 2 protein n=1 Tax=Flavobacterium cellulosilyticum TaxID=2541731 RepID=A0A4R5C8L5_9FLAO|nr:glycosyltransferase family A protein [Flavobacterium cellulosilyticum]TDD96191.1 glycosyltransferase family 2 protein [Flavobacterium cellulosilyticum]
MAFFSIIIPLYNKENYVEKTLRSINNQTFVDFEVLIINDCSTDSSIEKTIPFLSDKIKLFHHKTNKGLSASRNTGIQNANADYITFLDADDTWKPNFLETIHRLITNFPEARIFGTNYEEVYKTQTLQPQNGSENLAKHFEGIIDFFKINLKQGIYNHGSVCFHKNVFEKAGYYDETIDFSEDIDFNIRANYFFKLAYSNSIQMSYLMQSENQLTTSSILNKRLPDYDKYEAFANSNLTLKKYLDFERYVLSKHIKVDGNTILSKKIQNSIDVDNLNWKQHLLLKSPVSLLKCFNKIKFLLIRLGFKFTSY